MTPTDKVLKEFDEKYSVIQVVNLKRPHAQVYNAAAHQQIKSFITTALTQAYRRGVEEVVEIARKKILSHYAPINGAGDLFQAIEKEARLTETPL